MYLRTTRRKNRDGSLVEYYQLAESVWNPQRQQSEVEVVYNFGRADLLDKQKLERLAASIRRVCQPQGLAAAEGADAIESVSLDWSKPVGGLHVVQSLWESLGIPKALRDAGADRADAAPHELAIQAMVAQRLFEPASKLACHEKWLADLVYWPQAKQLTLSQLYHAMNFLEDNAEAIERAVFERTADLFNLEVDLIFWDTTSMYFEIDEEDTEPYWHDGREYEPLRKRGKSKEGRENDPQVVVGLAVTREGLPVRS